MHWSNIMHVRSELNKTLIIFALTVCAHVVLFSMWHFAYAEEICSGDGKYIESTTGEETGRGSCTPSDNEANLSNNGILGCLGQGARTNVGTTRAIGGVYVPVNDAAVTLNTGFLVYKECILDGMARKIAESGTAELGRQTLTALQTGRGGNAQYLQNFGSFSQPYNTQITVNSAQAIANSQMCQAFRGRVATAVARSFAYSQNSGNAALACSFASDADRTAMVTGSVPTSWGPQWMGLIGGDYEMYQENQAIIQNEARMARFDNDMRQMIMMGRGVVPIFDNNTNPLAMNVVTPGFIIADAISQVTGSGYRQLENANEIDQVVANLWGGLTTRLLSSGSGIPGLFTSNGNQPSYIDRMVAETQAAVRAGAVNAAVIALSGARANEASYLAAKQETGNALLNAMRDLRSVENQCWNLIIPKVQDMAGSQTLSIATSTQFSDAVINDPTNNIRELASTTAAEILVSQQALVRIDQLLASVTNSGSSAAQQAALLEIDEMIAEGRLHSSQDAQNAATQRDSVTAALTTLINSTKTTWGDNIDANIGWCNVNNTAVVERWFNAWKQ